MSSPRIISGKAGGIRLKSVPGNITRPITDRVKEALFNIIGSDIYETDFLDLFGGTGSVGIEALSRGARFARFIEKNRKAFSIIQENLRKTRLDSCAEVFHLDAFKYLAKQIDHQFDFIFVAPPQYKNIWLKVLQKIDKQIDVMRPEAILIVQIDPVEYFEHQFNNLKEIQRRKYSNSLLIFYKRGD